MKENLTKMEFDALAKDQKLNILYDLLLEMRENIKYPFTNNKPATEADNPDLKKEGEITIVVTSNNIQRVNQIIGTKETLSDYFKHEFDNFVSDINKREYKIIKK